VEMLAGLRVVDVNFRISGRSGKLFAIG